MARKQIIKFLSGILLLVTIFGTGLSVYAAPQAQDDTPIVISSEYSELSSYFSIETLEYSNGAVLEKSIINGPSSPSAEYAEEIAASIQPLPSAGVLTEFPAYSWMYGCSAVSGAMIAGYFDRHDYPNLYNGPANGGVMPLSDTAWTTWSDGYRTYPNNPLVASHKGVDGRTAKGSIDDYWVKVGSTANDPYLTGGWPQHTYGTAIGDYMATSQSVYNSDGATTFFYWDGIPDKLTCADMVPYKIQDEDGTYGRKLFYEARGYTVSDCYFQRTDNDVPGGFSLADFKAQIDAGNPVMLNLNGHTIVGYGYGTGNTIYIRDTWDNNPNHTYTMQWGGSYEGMTLYGVSIVNLQKSTSKSTLISPSYSTDSHYPQYKWTAVPGASDYQIEIYAGTYRMFTDTQGSQICEDSFCVYTPAKFLPDRGYTWRVRSKVNDSWGPWSSYKWFNVATNFSSPFSSDTKGWNTVFGPWSSFNDNFYRSTGWIDNFNSIVHDGLYPTLMYTVRMLRIGDQYSANRVVVRAAPYPLGENKAWNNGYLFQYTNDGKFSVWKTVNGVTTTLKGWTATGAIKPYNWNLLKVVANGTRLEFHINNKLVWVGNDSSLSNGRVGIGMVKEDPASPLWQPLLVDIALLSTTVSSSSPGDVILSEQGETIPDWDNPDLSPPGP